MSRSVNNHAEFNVGRSLARNGRTEVDGIPSRAVRIGVRWEVCTSRRKVRDLWSRVVVQHPANLAN